MHIDILIINNSDHPRFLVGWILQKCTSSASNAYWYLDY